MSSRSTRSKRQKTSSSQRSTRSSAGGSEGSNAMQIDEQPEMSGPLTQGSQSSVSRRDKPSSQQLSSQLSDPIFLSAPLHYGSSQLDGSENYRRRPDITTESGGRVHQINLSQPAASSQPVAAGSQDATRAELSSQPASQQSQQPDADKVIVWGTNVSIEQCKRRFKEFLKCKELNLTHLEIDEINMATPADLLDQDGVSQGPPAYYIQKLDEIYTLEDPYLNVNCLHIKDFDEGLYRKMVQFPQEVIPAFDIGTNELFRELYPQGTLPHPINVRPYNVAKTYNLRSLNPEDINQLITLSGMVIRCSTIIPEMVVAFFECSICSSSKTVEVDRGRIVEPALCGHCNTNFSFRLVHNRSIFIDRQQVKLQESPDDMPAGQTPYTVLLYAVADLVDAVQPGDRVTVTGIYRATPVRLNPRQRNVKSVYRTHIDVVHFRKVDSKRLHDESKEFHFTPDRIDLLKSLSRKPDIYERLAHAIAPSIYGYEDMKKGVLLQLFGGTRKDASSVNNAKWRHFRSEINIIICGDPGTSKSQLLKYVYSLVPRGQYTSGKGSSAVGLTAYITKDSDTKQLVLQTGALVLSDGGICCIDEFDKMSEATRSVLHEVMEQQTLSIAKAGIVCQLNARTSLLCAANPVESQWNSKKTIIENIQLPHTLLSRFDLIFLVVDPQREDYDRRLGRHLVSMYWKTNEEEEEDVLSTDILKDYIAYARNYVHPKLSEDAGQLLIHTYVDMRKVGSGRGQITAYPRQLEALIRLAEAHAKMRLSNVVELEDAEEAIRLHREAIKQAATDPSSGKIDVSILTTGVSASRRKNRERLAEALRNLLSAKKAGDETASQEQQYSYQPILAELKEKASMMVTREMFEDAVKDLSEEGFLQTIGGKFIRLV